MHRVCPGRESEPVSPRTADSRTGTGLRARCGLFCRTLRRYSLRGALFVSVAGATSVANADTPVAMTTVSAADAYEVARRYAGTVVPRRRSGLGFPMGGEVDRISVDIGDAVEAGQTLAILDQDTLKARVERAEAAVTLAHARVRAARAEAALARQNEERYRRLVDGGHASTQRYDEFVLGSEVAAAAVEVALAELSQSEALLRQAVIDLDDTVIRAPFSGRIQSRHVDEGAQVGPGAPVLLLIEDERPEVHISLPDDLATSLEPGSTVEFQWNRQALTGTLTSVLPEVESTTRALKAIVELDTASVPGGALVEAALVTRVPAAGFWVPVGSLAESERGLWSVYVLGEDSRLERRVVEVIHAESARAYVRGTLASGDRIVADGVQRVVPGQRVIAVDVGPESGLAVAAGTAR